MKKVREKLNAKLRKSGGFTLVEMLIVVAIIAILIAVSIPLVNNALDRAKHSTDAANERAAKAEIMIQYLAGEGIIKVDTDYIYDAVEGSLKETGTVNNYGQHEGHDYLKVQISNTGVVTVAWNTPGKGLCSKAKDVAHST